MQNINILPTKKEIKAFKAYQRSIKLKWLLAYPKADIENKSKIKQIMKNLRQNLKGFENKPFKNITAIKTKMGMIYLDECENKYLVSLNNKLKHSFNYVQCAKGFINSLFKESKKLNSILEL